mmetsp:Transcript_8808/g.32571  ORF Transcript_8808/g.32571 Transcript_8808/m.32571 type:complete len:180 (-) Transcript_8808:145-684(-)
MTQCAAFTNQNTCLCVLAPEECEQIQEISRMYDARRNPLHINLFFPFSNEKEYWSEWRTSINNLGLHSCRILFSEPYRNEGSKFLLARVESKDLVEVRKKIERAVCSKMKSNVFHHPSGHQELHISLGIRPQGELESLIVSLQRQWKKEEFSCNDLVFMVRKGVGQPWIVRDRIPLIVE